MKNYYQYMKKEKAIVKPVISISEEIKENIKKLKKKVVSKLFSEKALNDTKSLEILLLVDHFETLTSNLIAMYEDE